MKTLSISIQDNTYHELKRITNPGEVSQFIDKLISQEIAKKKQRLIEGYQRVAKSKSRREEDKI
jgi:predicted CopG family antitoxin